MADNDHLYGFRWVKGANGGKPCPEPEVLTIANAQDDQDQSANSIDINIGDTLLYTADGGAIVAKTTTIVSWICVGVEGHWSAEQGVWVRDKKIPNQTTWGTLQERSSRILAVPADAGVWEIDCDTIHTTATWAGYQALINLNVEHTVPGRTATTDADPYIDISAAANTAGMGWRIVGISPRVDQDFTGNYVKMLVKVNESGQAGAPIEGSLVAGI